MTEGQFIFRLGMLLTVVCFLLITWLVAWNPVMLMACLIVSPTIGFFTGWVVAQVLYD